jgi:protein required for attachment to host cells
MNRTCVVAADAGLARFFAVEEVEAPRAKLKLVERTVLHNPDLRALGKSASARPYTETNTNREAGSIHPTGAQRERHRIEIERRFGVEIINAIKEITKDWQQGTVILVAAPHLLGLMRETVRKALHQGIELKELAKDFAHLSATELLEHLALNRIIPQRPHPASSAGW